MKRCPQCEFIYEDEQDLCDMDGRELERAPAAAAPPGAATRQTRPPTARSRRPLLALLITVGALAAILTSGYYVQTSQTATGRIDSAPAGVAPAGLQTETTPSEIIPSETTPPETTPSPESPARAPGPTPESPRTSPASPPKTKVTKVLPSADAPRKSAGGDRSGGSALRSPATPAARREEKASGPESPGGRREAKKESKLGAALKKAGRVLKKPFGF